MSNEACMTQLLKHLGKPRKHEQETNYIVGELQKILSCSIDRILPIVAEYKINKI